MAAYINVFLTTARTIEIVVAEIQRILGTEFALCPDEFGPVYSSHYMGWNVLVFEAKDYLDDRNLNLTAFQMQVNLGPLTEDQDRDARLREVAISLARQLFEGLHWPTLVVDDVQVLIERFGR
jgi:hypothetical protein